ncbi:MAG: HAD-IIB family hydrolase [Candidatus Thiodiazotropha sp. (ex. Lucinisca nassula)]|nr:HAD-IIB family hydrolase [Candidatus Thiodiazotropha sp. (ex. Lucinisca nassula)]MBW9272452.1 HAD-IIB family hydrolase [Candidatus Thiodiazotropha sp. (ex. Lucinisca nassula)]
MNQRLLICTDLDRTLIPNGPQPESEGARERFKQLCASETVLLAYVSGRDQSLVRDAIADYSLPQPDYVIGDVGTSLYHVDTPDDWSHQANWDEHISQDWRGRSHQDLKQLFADIPGLRLQEEAKQNRFKLSYYVSPDQAHQPILDEMGLRLQREKVAASLVWSVDETVNMGLLDVLPERATKYHAVDFLRQSLGYTLNETVFSGDSGNDMEVLISPIPAVLVANAQPEVRQKAQQLVDEKGNGDSLYMAKGSFMAMNGNYSAGILEGAAHYHPQLISRLIDE